MYDNNGSVRPGVPLPGLAVFKWLPFDGLTDGFYLSLTDVVPSGLYEITFHSTINDSHSKWG
jgi:hypothetical protein